MAHNFLESKKIWNEKCAVYNVITVAFFALNLICVASVPTTLKSTLKIVNSTNIRELKHNFAAEDKAVAYVYPVGTDESAQSSWTASVSLPKTEAERMAAPKKHSSQVKDTSLSAKSTVNPTVKAGKDFPATSGSNDSTAEKLEEKMATSATGKMETRSDAESKINNTSLERTSIAPTLSNTQRNQNTTSDNGKPDCFTRVLSHDDETLVVYNSTRQEVEAMGLEVFDSVCKGDEDWDKVISAGALASLCCGSG